MSTVYIIQTLFEFAAICLVIYGLCYEDKLIAFERRLIRKIKRKLYNFIVKLEEVKNDKSKTITY